MVTLSDLKVKYIISDEPIKPKDHFVYNNPLPNSHMKNVVMECAFVEDEFIVPLDNYLAYRQYRKERCKKLILINEKA